MLLSNQDMLSNGQRQKKRHKVCATCWIRASNSAIVVSVPVAANISAVAYFSKSINLKKMECYIIVSMSSYNPEALQLKLL